jgi:Putative beta-barrel porin 2
MNNRPTLLALVACLVCSAGALAQSSQSPYYIGIKQDVTHESNALNGVAGSETSDTISTTSLLGGLNIPFGRQRAFVNASVFHQGYSNISARNNNGYDLGAGLDWSTIERLSGSLSVNSNRRQSDFFVGGIVPVSLSNIERSTDANARARLGLDTAFAFDASLGHRQVAFSAPEFASREYHQNSGSLGVSYRPSGILTLGAGVSGQRTVYETAAIGQSVPDKSKRQDAYLSANWVPTGASTVNARVNVGKTEYDLATAANFSGVTGYLTWAWKPTGLLGLTTTLSRETGQEAGFQQAIAGTKLTATDFSRVTDAVRVQADYELTGKIKMNAGVGYARRNLVDGFTAVAGNDNTTSLSLGARWAAMRTLTVGCDISRESRSSGGTGSSDYDNNRFGCFGQFTID